VTVLTVTLQQGAETLSMIGDVLLGFGPYLAHFFAVGLGWLGFSGRLELTAQTWVLVTVGMLVLLVMFDTGAIIDAASHSRNRRLDRGGRGGSRDRDGTVGRKHDQRIGEYDQ